MESMESTNDDGSNELGDDKGSSDLFGWKTVHVKANQDDTDEDDNNKTTANKTTRHLCHNHYDHKMLQKTAERELEASPQEAPGIFFGLEVLSGDAYRMEPHPQHPHQRIMVPTREETRKRNETSDSEPNTTQKRKRRKDEAGQEAKDTVAKESEDHGDKPKQSQKRKRPKDKASETVEPNDTTTTTEADQSTKGDEEQPTKQTDEPKPKKQKKKKKKKKSKKKKAETDEKDSKPVDKDPSEEDQAQILNMQMSWAAQMGGVSLHKRLCASLLKQGFWSPTPIQAAALPAAILGRRNIVGAAPTGSGKTLAFLLPIGQHLLTQGGEQVDNNKQRPLQALILTPTRELALQIHSESEKLLGSGTTGTLVGGLAHAKQIRVLEKKQPPIVVATPGRLWEMMSSHEYTHLNDLSQIRFLVIDEADRMIQQGSFPQLAQILDAVQRANPMDDDEEEESDMSDGEDETNTDRLLGLPGVPGEAKLRMLDENLLLEIERQRNTESDDVRELNDTEFTKQVQLQEGGADEDEEDDASQLSLPQSPPVDRQTFVYSATLTLPASANFSKSKRQRFQVDVDGAIAEILEKSRARGKTKVVDLSNVANKKTTSSDSTAKNTKQKETSKQQPKETFRLPEGLSLQQMKCTQRHKDSHLYAFLMATAEGSSGPCLVFCNSIAGVRRVGTTLQTLGLDVRILHAQMQQRARFKAVELLQESKKRTVVVATDVAARGLDIPSVASIVHYDTARTVDSFVHRSGRTSRGIGPDAVGCSVSLVSPDEDKMQMNIAKALNVKFEPVAVDGRLLNEAQERVNLASKVAMVRNMEQKSQRQNQWLKGKASDAGLELDDDLLDEGLAGGDARDQAKLQEAQRAQKRLFSLLSQPMKTQRFGKFLSTNSAHKQGIVSHTPTVQTSRKRRRRR